MEILHNGLYTQNPNEMVSRVDEEDRLKATLSHSGQSREMCFLAKDVANWIEHKNPSKMLNGVELDNTELVKNFIEITYSYGNSSRTRKQESLFLTEDGLYEVLMQSRKSNRQ